MDSSIIAALVVAIPAAAAAIASWRNGRGIKAVRKEVTSNGGKRIGERIEQLNEDFAQVQINADTAARTALRTAAALERQVQDTAADLVTKTEDTAADLVTKTEATAADLEGQVAAALLQHIEEDAALNTLITDHIESDTLAFERIENALESIPKRDE